MRYKGKNTKKYGDHYKAIYDTVLIVSWVTMAPPQGLPHQHCNGQLQSADFNLNRVLKNDKSQEAKDFIKATKAVNKKICEYVKEYFKTSGLTWNPKGGSLSDAKASSGGSTSGGASEQKEAPKNA